MVGEFLRRRKPEASANHPAEGAALLPDGASSADDDSKMVPVWAEPLLCGSKAAHPQRPCLGGECELLHLPASCVARACRVPRGGRGMVVVCAGPERSGSTWLFNAVRLILQATGERVHSYWIQHLTQSVLVKRGLCRTGPDAAHVVVKTHHWSSEWDPASVDVIFLTERDIAGVVRSYLRVGWLSPGLDHIVPVMEQYVAEHAKWKAICTQVVPFEAISNPSAAEREQLAALGRRILPEGAVVDYDAISGQVAALPVPTHHMDVVSKLWPAHLSSRGPLTREPVGKLSEAEAVELKQRLAPLLVQS